MLQRVDVLSGYVIEGDVPGTTRHQVPGQNIHQSWKRFWYLMNALVAVESRVYALSTAALSRRLRLVTVCSKRLIVSATWVTCSVLVMAVWLLPLLDAGVPGVSFEKTFLCSHPSLCLSTWGVVCLALMYAVQCYMVRKLGPWLPTPFTVS